MSSECIFIQNLHTFVFSLYIPNKRMLEFIISKSLRNFPPEKFIAIQGNNHMKDISLTFYQIRFIALALG